MIVAIEKEITVLQVNEEVVITATEKEVQAIEAMDTLVIYQGGVPSDQWVVGEIPTGTVDGSNATFTTAFDFVPESVEVFLETCRLGLLDDYNTSGTRTIIFYVSPLAGEKIKINYLKQ